MKHTCSLLVVVGILLAAAAVSAAEFVTFSYDTAGRLIGVNSGGGKSASFHYDVTGNLKRSAVAVVVDSDNDGMADAWETNYFKSLARDGSGDFDLDGFSDAAEYLAGTLPDDSNSLLRMSRNVTNTIAQTTVSWSSVAGKTYRVQYKAHLGDSGWNDLAGLVTATGTNSVKVDVTSAAEPQRYYRVELAP